MSSNPKFFPLDAGPIIELRRLGWKHSQQAVDQLVPAGRGWRVRGEGIR